METLACTYRQSSHLALRSLGDEVVAITTHDSRVHELNETAGLLVLACETPRTLSGLVDVVVARFDVARDEAEAEVAAFLSLLVEAGLLSREP
jgi:hypothetical protein